MIYGAYGPSCEFLGYVQTSRELNLKPHPVRCARGPPAASRVRELFLQAIYVNLLSSNEAYLDRGSKTRLLSKAQVDNY